MAQTLGVLYRTMAGRVESLNVTSWAKGRVMLRRALPACPSGRRAVGMTPPPFDLKDGFVLAFEIYLLEYARLCWYGRAWNLLFEYWKLTGVIPGDYSWRQQ